MGRILFEKLHLPVKKKTASGAPSTDEEVLTELALGLPLAQVCAAVSAACEVKAVHTPTNCLKWLTMPTGGFIRLLVRLRRSQGVWRAQNRTCRIFQYERQKAGVSVRHLWLRLAARFCRLTTLRLSCASWCIYPEYLGCWPFSGKGAIFTGRPAAEVFGVSLVSGNRSSAPYG